MEMLHFGLQKFGERSNPQDTDGDGVKSLHVVAVVVVKRIKLNHDIMSTFRNKLAGCI